MWKKEFEAFVKLGGGGILIWVAVAEAGSDRIRRMAWSTERNGWAVRWEGDRADEAEAVARKEVMRVLRLMKLGIRI